MCAIILLTLASFGFSTTRAGHMSWTVTYTQIPNEYFEQPHYDFPTKYYYNMTEDLTADIFAIKTEINEGNHQWVLHKPRIIENPWSNQLSSRYDLRDCRAVIEELRAEWVAGFTAGENDENHLHEQIQFFLIHWFFELTIHSAGNRGYIPTMCK